MNIHTVVYFDSILHSASCCHIIIITMLFICVVLFKIPKDTLHSKKKQHIGIKETSTKTEPKH